MVQMAEVDDIGPEFVEHTAEGLIQRRMDISVLMVRHVDSADGDGGGQLVGLVADEDIRLPRDFLAGEDANFVPLAGKFVAKRLRVNLGTGAVGRGLAVDDLEDTHGVRAIW
jgi:hypothetical protein